jgi:pimeloyl-ACP methyl ester carboxylesterase
MHRRINDLEVAVCIVGEGKPVVALHGWGGGIRSFWPVAERLAPYGYQVHVLDLPGFGQSELPPQPWSVVDYARFVVAFLDDFDLPQVSFLGHSFGGRIGLVLAADYPARIDKMVLADSAGIRTPLTARQHVRNFLARSTSRTLERLRLDGWRARLQDRYNRRYASEDYLTAGPLRETFLRVIQQDLSTYAARIQAPTVLIWGDQDKDTPLWQGKKLEQTIPDAGLIVFEGAGHFAYLERLGEYVRIVHHFLSSGS